MWRQTRGSNQIRFDLSEATYQFEPNSIFVDISFAAKYCQPTFGGKGRSRPQSKGENHTIEKLYGPPDEVCKVLKFLFSEYSTVGFLFAFYHHTYPEANKKEAINLRLWNYGDEKYLPKCRNRDFLAGKQKFWTHISIQEQLNS